MKYNLNIPFKKEQAIKRFKKLLDTGATIELKEIKGKRSISQNALYWLWLTCIEAETGNSKEDLHEYFKVSINGYEEIKLYGKTLQIPISTTKDDTKQFKEYLDKIQIFASVELGIDLPDPDHKHFTDFYKEYC